MPQIHFRSREERSIWKPLPERALAADCADVWAVMFGPKSSDRDFRARFLDAMEKGHLNEDACWRGIGERVVSAWSFDRHAYSGAPDVVLAEAEDRVGQRGDIAGWILIYALANKCSVKKASEALTSAAVEAGMTGFGWSNLRQHMWKPFQRVAHFWAALICMRAQPLADWPRDTFHRFLELAEWFRVSGEAYKPPRSKQTLLDARTWTLPEEIRARPTRYFEPSIDDLRMFGAGAIIQATRHWRPNPLDQMILPTFMGQLRRPGYAFGTSVQRDYKGREVKRSNICESDNFSLTLCVSDLDQ